MTSRCQFDVFLARSSFDVLWKLSPSVRIVEPQFTPKKLGHQVDTAKSFIECCKEYRPAGSVCKFYRIQIINVVAHRLDSLW